MSLDILLNESKLKHGAVEFDKVNEEDFVPAIKEAVRLAKERLEIIKNNSEEPSFENVIEDLELCGLELDRVLTVFYNLFSAEANDTLQALAPEVAALSSNFSSDLNLDPELFVKVKAVYDKKDQLKLSPEQNMLLEKFYKGFVRNGASLEEAKKEELRLLDEELAKLSPKFSENVLKATNAYELRVEDSKRLAGLPQMAIEAAREEAVQKGIKKKDVWIFTLDAPSMLPVLKYADDREMRKDIWTAFRSRCVNDDYSNLENIKKIVSLRHKRARLLGFDNHADYVLEERMAGNSKTVMDFLNNLKGASKQAAEKDLKEVSDYALQNGLEGELEPFDFSYYSEKLRKEKYSFDSEALRPYLPVEKCISGAFQLAEKLFSIRFEENKDLPTYHKDVITYEVYDKNTNDFVGLFYADFFPRATKRGGAWMTSFKTQGWNGTRVERPHVSIVCNFTKPTQGKPSLISFQELETLFHEFGHSLHGMLSKCRYKTLAGTNVYWDFVELPSQFMENWLLEKEVLDMFAQHYETGESIPAEMIEKLQASAKFNAGYQSLRQLNFGVLDMAWHGTYLDQIDDVVAFEVEATKDTDLFGQYEGMCSSASFSHIFAGGYSAGYYSYKWAEVLDADAFEYFKENSLFDAEVAKKYKTNILEKGGSEDPAKLYREFRGKDPDPKALLRRDGLI